MGSKVTLLAQVIALIVATSAPAAAQESAAYQRGIEAYQRGDYETARKAFQTAFEETPSPDILFAWGQAERYGGDCRRAIELFDDALNMKLSDEQKQVITDARADCDRVVRQAEKIAEEERLAEERRAAREKRALEEKRAYEAARKSEQQPPKEPPAEPARDEGSPWYTNPVGGTLVASGLIGLGVGLGFSISANSADDDADQATTYDDYATAVDRAKSRRTIANVASIAGASLVGLGVVWYVVAGGGDDHGGGDRVSAGPIDGGFAVSWTGAF